MWACGESFAAGSFDMARLHEVVVRELAADIVSGRFVPGEWLPREVDLAERFEISRGVARECIRALEERSLIRVRHGRGAQVLEPREWDVLDVIVAEEILRGPMPSDLLVEYLECRQGLEIEAAGLAARRSSEQDRAELATAYAAMAASWDSEAQFLAADVRFHEALAQASGNRVMAQTLLRMHSALLCARLPLARPERRLDVGLPEHERILIAVQAGDEPAAREAMTVHLATIERYVTETTGH